jgi:6-pyruvoyltetrahydropterin/6-carboxytetrahydropterin synthase
LQKSSKKRRGAEIVLNLIKIERMVPVVHITRRERFNAAHRLFRPDFDEVRNLEVFGKCSNPQWHGHNYILFVTVAGPVNTETGFLVNLKWLSNLIRERIIEKIDHKNINLEVDFMAGKMASTENLAVAVWEELAEPVSEAGAELFRVRIEETENNYVEYFGAVAND